MASTAPSRSGLILPAAPRPNRRMVVRNLGAGALAATLLAAGPVGRLAARETTGEIASPFFADFLDDWATAAATGDAAPVLPYYAEDAILEDVPSVSRSPVRRRSSRFWPGS